MSNKYLLPLIIAILISTIVAVSVNQFNKPSNNRVAIVSSSNVIMTQSSQSRLSSVSSQIVSSSSLVKAQSSLPLVVSLTPKVVESKAVESVKVQSQKPDENNSTISIQKCDIVESDMILKVQTENLCFAGVNWYGDPNPNYPTTTEFANTRKPIIIDYYQRVIKLGASKKSSVNMQYYLNVSDNEYDFFLTLEDFARFQKEYPNATEKAGPLGYNKAQYKITKDANNKWNWKLVSIEEK
jgi:hypothetical protein